MAQILSLQAGKASVVILRATFVQGDEMAEWRKRGTSTPNEAIADTWDYRYMRIIKPEFG